MKRRMPLHLFQNSNIRRCFFFFFLNNSLALALNGEVNWVRHYAKKHKSKQKEWKENKKKQQLSPAERKICVFHNVVNILFRVCAGNITATFEKRKMLESAPTYDGSEQRIKKASILSVRNSVCTCVSAIDALSVYHYHCRHRCMRSMCACEKHVLTNTLAMAHHYIGMAVTNTRIRDVQRERWLPTVD